MRVAVARMAGAIRLSLFEKGLDPEDFTLLSFGGASGYMPAIPQTRSASAAWSSRVIPVR